MDAVEFIREEIRMCASYQDCTECPLYDTAYCSVSPKKRTQEEAREIVLRVEEWCASHPRKTRQSLFIHQHPKVATYNGVIGIRPCQLEEGYTSPYCLRDESKCVQCRKEYWLQEVD